MAITAATNAEVPVAVHLDHAGDLVLVQQAVATGFSSVMVDGSALPWDDNVALLQHARDLVPVALEAELGGVGGTEDRAGSQATDIPKTDPAEAAALVAGDRHRQPGGGHRQRPRGLLR